MITVVSGWVEWSYRVYQTQQTSFGRTFGRGVPGEQANKFRAVIGVFSVEAPQHENSGMASRVSKDGFTYPYKLSADTDLDCRKKELQAKFILLSFDYPWIDGLHPNKALDRGDVVSLFPECKDMPRPIALDYARDRA